MPPVLGVQGLNHWTARSVPFMYFFSLMAINITGLSSEVVDMHLQFNFQDITLTGDSFWNLFCMSIIFIISTSQETLNTKD